MSAKFKVGDRVRAVNNTGMQTWIKDEVEDELVFTIADVHAHEHDRYHYSGDPFGYGVWEENLELVSATSMRNAFKAGDRVRLTGNLWGERAGSIRTIDGVDSSEAAYIKEDGIYLFILDGGYEAELIQDESDEHWKIETLNILETFVRELQERVSRLEEERVSRLEEERMQPEQPKRSASILPDGIHVVDGNYEWVKVAEDSWVMLYGPRRYSEVHVYRDEDIDEHDWALKG